jgi:hypothetical protein
MGVLSRARKQAIVCRSSRRSGSIASRSTGAICSAFSPLGFTAPPREHALLALELLRLLVGMRKVVAIAAVRASPPRVIVRA